MRELIAGFFLLVSLASTTFADEDLLKYNTLPVDHPPAPKDLNLNHRNRGVYYGCPSPWICEPVELKNSGVLIRVGVLPAVGEFRGNVLYLEGLGDSILNHKPLFDSLTAAGFQVIAFDYQGQGGSTGRMNDTRISGIYSLALQVWSRYARDLSLFSEKNIIGWSTGGLAAYYFAHEQKAGKVVLIAPGICPNAIVGEQDIWHGDFNKITLKSLTTAEYPRDGLNPHVDPIYPKSPLDVKTFALNLMGTALVSQHWNIDKNVKGFVLLSGDQDTYVDASATKKVLSAHAPLFEVKQYPGALHEIDNETTGIGDVAIKDITDFLVR